MAVDYLIVLLAVCIFVWIISTPDNENVLIKNIFKKIKIYVDSLVFMALSKDSKGVGQKKNPDPDIMKGKATAKKTIVFIRHGESDWNNVFNKGLNPMLIVRLIKTGLEELKVYPSTNSYFLDSPLNYEGIDQALELRNFIESAYDKIPATDPAFSILASLSSKHTDRNSIIVSSSLRRAVATTTLGLWPRIEKTGEKIHILSSLQEISRNIDTFALSAAGTVADLPFQRLAPHCGGDKFNPLEVFDTTQSFGNKSYDFYGIKRLRSFSEWAMQRPEERIIVGGHSLWFKYFFQTFLPHAVDHDAKKKKIVNSGVVAFTLETCIGEDGVAMYRIDPNSIQNIYGGFTTK